MRLSMRVWDLPSRVAHHAAVVLLAADAVAVFGRFGWGRGMDWALLVCVLWRVLWGVAGSETARFAALLGNPLAVLGATDLGAASAAGGVLVPVMLAGLGLEAASGIWGGAALHRDAVLAVLGLSLAHVGLLLVWGRRHADSVLRLALTGKLRRPASARAPKLAGPGLALLALAGAAGAVVALRLLP